MMPFLNYGTAKASLFRSPKYDIFLDTDTSHCLQFSDDDLDEWYFFL